MVSSHKINKNSYPMQKNIRFILNNRNFSSKKYKNISRKNKNYLNNVEYITKTLNKYLTQHQGIFKRVEFASKIIDHIGSIQKFNFTRIIKENDKISIIFGK